MPTQDQKCFTNICLLFYLNPRTIRLYTCTLFIGLHIALSWLPYIYSWWFGSNPSFIFNSFFFFFFSFKARRVSKWYWLADRNRISNKPMFYYLFSELTNMSHGLYECFCNKAKSMLAKSHPPLTLRSVGKWWNSYRIMWIIMEKSGCSCPLPNVVINEYSARYCVFNF